MARQLTDREARAFALRWTAVMLRHAELGAALDAVTDHEHAVANKVETAIHRLAGQLDARADKLGAMEPALRSRNMLPSGVMDE